LVVVLFKRRFVLLSITKPKMLIHNQSDFVDTVKLHLSFQTLLIESRAAPKRSTELIFFSVNNNICTELLSCIL
jgi:hypothetical protein